MVAMIKFKPELAKSTPSERFPPSPNPNARPMSAYSSPSARHGSISSRRSVLLVGANGPQEDQYYGDFDDDDTQVGEDFTYIPPNPKKYYKRLLELCLVGDLENMLSPEVDDNEEVSLGILSQANIELLNECALRWRIGQPYRSTCFLDLVRSFYERNDVPMECVPEALQGVAKVMQDVEPSKWPVFDVCCLPVRESPFDTFLFTARLPLHRIWKYFQYIFIGCLPCHGFTAESQAVDVEPSLGGAGGLATKWPSGTCQARRPRPS